ncbi:nitroreductase family deazaflavin-dependent oxidoreductase [Streptomyces sp. NPDC059176]|uniref:nitroreductase family deazaflavin-dependent oxidoreductase n=1 Tax=unclassified Streptomyces TaxID=2593676 RepID=UPI00367E4B90
METPDTEPHRREPPTGWARLAARLPIHMYRCGLGFLFGRRMLLLIHTGRLSGATRRVVLEVVEYEPDSGAWTVASGFGPTAQWYRNLQHVPQATIQVGRRYHAVTARFLPAEDGSRIMAGYAEAHPRTAARLCAYLGLPGDGTQVGYRAAGEQIPFVRLEPSPARGETQPRRPEERR